VLVTFLCWTALSSSPASQGADLFGGTSFGELVALCLTLQLGAGLVADELESGHAALVLLRPVSRSAWFLGRLAGAGLVLLCALGLAWVLAWVPAFRAGQGLGWQRLLALPLGFLFAFGWLATLAALSVVARGATNAAWLLLATIGWFLLWGAAGTASAVERMRSPEAGLAARAFELIRAVHPFMGPQDPTRIQTALQSGQPVDWMPLGWDLLWVAGACWIGVRLLAARELGRRRV
jgi:ABC-type Na+ efflux pump permease subunit